MMPAITFSYPEAWKELLNKKISTDKGDALNGEFKKTLSASIAFDRTNALWAKLKPIYVNPQNSYFASGNPYTSRKR